MSVQILMSWCVLWHRLSSLFCLIAKSLEWLLLSGQSHVAQQCATFDSIRTVCYGLRPLLTQLLLQLQGWPTETKHASAYRLGSSQRWRKNSMSMAAILENWQGRNINAKSFILTMWDKLWKRLEFEAALYFRVMHIIVDSCKTFEIIFQVIKRSFLKNF